MEKYEANRLKDRITEDDKQMLTARLREKTAENDRLRVRIAELEEALRPFANAHDIPGRSWVTVTSNDFKRAYEVLYRDVEP